MSALPQYVSIKQHDNINVNACVHPPQCNLLARTLPNNQHMTLSHTHIPTHQLHHRRMAQHHFPLSHGHTEHAFQLPRLLRLGHAAAVGEVDEREAAAQWVVAVEFAEGGGGGGEHAAATQEDAWMSMVRAERREVRQEK